MSRIAVEFTGDYSTELKRTKKFLKKSKYYLNHVQAFEMFYFANSTMSQINILRKKIIQDLISFLKYS